MIEPSIDVAVLILNYNSYKLTIELVKELLSETSNLNILYLIVDNCSINDSYSILKETFENYCNVIVLKNKINEGYAKGNNFGLKKLEIYNPKYVLIINNDVKFSLKTLKNCIIRYEQIDDVGILAPIQINSSGQRFPFWSYKYPTFKDDILNYLGYQKFKRPLRYKSNCKWTDLIQIDIISGSFLLINYSTFKRIGFFSEKTFLFMEESFIARKLKNINKNNYIFLGEEYIHAHSATIKNYHSLKSQYKLLLDSQIEYAKEYYKFNWLKIPILKILNKIYVRIIIAGKYFKK